MLKSGKILVIIRTMAIITVLAPFLHGNCLAEYTNPSIGDEASVSYWLDRGGFYAAYGNFSAAVKAYEKALVLSPDDSSAYFNLSLALCELGLYKDSLEAIEQAISRNPHNGGYYYAQAWILVKAGEAAKASAVFRHAADMGNRDAIAYLKSQD